VHLPPFQNLPHPCMPPLTAIRGADLPSVKVPGDGIQAGMARRLHLTNDRQNIGRKLRCLSPMGRTHAFRCARRVRGVPSRFPRALAAARAALVRSEISSRSCSATAARM
jgi:hypothetical protein